MKHIEFAKEAARMADLSRFDNEAKLVLWTAASASALIAIAEELEKIHKPSEQKYYDGLSDGNEIERLR